MEPWHERHQRSRSLCTLLLILILVMALAGCNDDNDSSVTRTPVAEDGQNDGPDDTEATNSFTLAVLPDTQKYSRYSSERFDAQTRSVFRAR